MACRTKKFEWSVTVTKMYQENIVKKSAHYRMRLTELEDGVRYGGLMFESYIEDDDIAPLSNPIFHDAIGDSVEYGSLFAYLFRRFGYPNSGWDDYKQLAKYHLTTPCKNMILQIVPFVGNDSTITFTFLIPMDIYRKLDNYAQRKHIAWQERFFCWHEKNAVMPKWMNRFVKELTESNYSKGDKTTWRDVYSLIPTLERTESENKQDEDDKKTALDWFQSINKAYKNIEKEPAFFEEFSKDWKAWSDDNPLKAYALGAYEALIELKKPVGIRDSQINALGIFDYDSSIQALKFAPVAGFPSGALGNKAPSKFAELHKKILEIGNGNAKKGINKILSLVDPNR